MNIFVMVGPLPGAKSASFQEANHVPGGRSVAGRVSGICGMSREDRHSYRQLRAVIDRTSNRIGMRGKRRRRARH